MKSIFQEICIKTDSKQKMLAILLDPDKCIGETIMQTIALLKVHLPDFIFVGGSHTDASSAYLVDVLKQNLDASVVLFPGNTSQFSGNADALLYLSLISGRNAEFLIGQHITTSISIKRSGIEVIPTGYLLIDGGAVSATEYISNTRSIPSNKKEIALSTAIAGELLGMILTYLEAGSGAVHPVPSAMIRYVKASLSTPLIVGGGIRSIDQLEEAYLSGADIVVVGNIFETEASKIAQFVALKEQFNSSSKESV